MGLFTRKRKDAGPRSEDSTPSVMPARAFESAETEDGMVVPGVVTLPADEQDRIDAVLARLAVASVDVDDAQAIGAAYDSWLAAFLATKESQRPDHQPMVDQIAVAIGEHLTRRTDLEWLLVTDPFGTDVGVGSRRDDFYVVPMNLVAVRWLNRTSGWVPGVVGHLVRVRS